MKINFQLNNERFELDLLGSTLLIDILRTEFGIKSIHPGCRSGHCGSCLVMMNNQAVPSCLVPAFICRDSAIETIEGISTSPAFVDIERGFLQSGFNPCSFCASSKALLTEAILRNDQTPSEASIQAAIPEHWCSCTGAEAYIQTVLTCHDIRRKRVKNVSEN